MSKITLAIYAFLFALTPLFAFAVSISSLFTVLQSLINFFQNLVPILVGLAVLVFFWGMVKFIAHAGDEKAVEEGKQLMIWGMVGIFVIVSLWAIVGFIQESLGLDSTGLLLVGSAPSIPTFIPTGI